MLGVCARQHESKIKSSSKIKGSAKIKSNGQECPFHTSNIKTNIKVKNGAECVRGSHSSQRTRGMGHPL